MAAACATCGKSIADLTGCFRAQVTHVTYVTGDPVTVTGDAEVVVLDFDTAACRDAWTTRSAPVAPV